MDERLLCLDQDTWPAMAGVAAYALGGIDNIDVYND